MLMKGWAVLCYVYIVFGDNEEQTCYSRFDYDEKMLTKLVKLEEKIKKMEKLIKKRINFETSLEGTVAFTVTDPANVFTLGSLTFATVISNDGDAFNSSTGKFICPISGMYYFSLHLVTVTEDTFIQMGCYITKNGLNKVRVYTEAPENGAFRSQTIYGVSNSVYLKLAKGDVVTAGDCNRNAEAKLKSWSSFSGYLVRPIM
ncbi:complement C1q-like protein 4 [Mercenaria mercenaria]|uniref:complement C1q-like protein 4 n=1 Tax=Mercenaria mercenaria TaxID=6596 RepID=UPI00234E42F8|nr:complement C1q-like protein 4 [Mercenaria mercenaria]